MQSSFLMLLGFFVSKVHSDFILERQPMNVSDAFQIFENITQNFGNKENHYKYAVPKTVQLVPINMVIFGILLMSSPSQVQTSFKASKGS